MVQKLICLFAFVLVAGTSAHYRRPRWLKGGRPELWMSSSQLIARAGYRPELHEVPTDDGYLLGLHRIVKPGPAAHGTPVLLGHGLASNSEQWLLRERNNLAFLLTDLGFDVWIANYRGSHYSVRHKHLSVRSPQFWNFSWHENGVSDQAAFIDHVLGVTRRPALLSLSHSMGATVQLVLLSERPEYSSKVLASALMAPPSVFNFTTSAFDISDKVLNYFPKVKNTAFTAIKRTSTLVPPCLLPFCFAMGLGKSPLSACVFALDFVYGKPSQPINEKLVEIFAAHWPERFSGGQLLHSMQGKILDGQFLKYDYGGVKNKQIYGTARPPPYNLSRISSPTHLYYSLNDAVVNYKDVENLAKLLPSLRSVHRISVDAFNHIDFFISSLAHRLVYMPVIQDLLRYVDTKNSTR